MGFTSSSIDLTALFSSCVKAIRTRNKAMGVSLPPSKVFPNCSSFYTKIRDVQSSINSHQNLLNEHYKKYVSNNEELMSNQERHYMEKVIGKNIKILDENIKNIELEQKSKSPSSSHADECQLNVISILKSNLQKLSSGFKKAIDLRHHRLKEKDKLLKLHRPNEKKKSIKSDLTTDVSFTKLSPSESDNQESVDNDNISKIEVSNTEDLVISSKSISHFIEDEMEELLEALSPEDRQLLEEENSHIYQELVSNKEEVKLLTKQVIELGQMQDMFSENVEIQARQIEEIQNTVISATENVREGNEQVREAMRNDAGFRVWIMFFLIVMSCTILFLDWYNQ